MCNITILSALLTIAGCADAAAGNGGPKDASASGSQVSWGEEIVDCDGAFPVEVAIPSGAIFQAEECVADDDCQTVVKDRDGGAVALGECQGGRSHYRIAWVELR